MSKELSWSDEIRSYLKSLAARTSGEYDEETDSVYYPSKQVYYDYMRKGFDLNKMITESIFETANEEVTDESK